MAGRKDQVVEELRAIRKRISARLLKAERKEGTCIPELRRMAREADTRMKNGAARGSRSGSNNGKKRRQK